MEDNIKRLLTRSAELAKSGDHKHAEDGYLQALRVSEALHGPESANVCLVLIELEEFYVSQDRRTDAKQVRDRMRRIMAQFAGELFPGPGPTSV